MAAKQRPQKRSLNSSKILVRVLIGMLLLVMLSSAIALYFEQEKQMDRILQRQAELSVNLQDAAGSLTELRELQQLVGSDAYIERVAREQLGMVKPNEVVFTDQ
ncbi:MAG: hypothetical protein GX173_07535 [Ruminococcaceae bacterium]|jgi:cell division protein FtsB|nr:hypothetical protein [Oscillospiraceae bacterium]